MDKLKGWRILEPPPRPLEQGGGCNRDGKLLHSSFKTSSVLRYNKRVKNWEIVCVSVCLSCLFTCLYLCVCMCTLSVVTRGFRCHLCHFIQHPGILRDKIIYVYDYIPNDNKQNQPFCRLKFLVDTACKNQRNKNLQL